MAPRVSTGDQDAVVRQVHLIYSFVLLPLDQPSGGVTTRGHCLKLQKRDRRTSLRVNVLGSSDCEFLECFSGTHCDCCLS